MNHSGFPVKAIRKASTHLTEEGRFLTRECVLKQSVSVGGVQPVKTESAFGIASFLGRKGGCLHRTIWRSLLKGSCASEAMPAKSWQSLVFSGTACHCPYIKNYHPSASEVWISIIFCFSIWYTCIVSELILYLRRNLFFGSHRQSGSGYAAFYY